MMARLDVARIRQPIEDDEWYWFFERALRAAGVSLAIAFVFAVAMSVLLVWVGVTDLGVFITIYTLVFIVTLFCDGLILLDYGRDMRENISKRTARRIARVKIRRAQRMSREWRYDKLNAVLRENPEVGAE